MAWEKHDQRAYYYRSIRVGGRVKKVYCGAGVVGRSAAEADARRRIEEQARRSALLAEKQRLKELESLAGQLGEQCELLAEAALLAAGYHRPFRQPWRRSHAARRAFPGCAARCR